MRITVSPAAGFATAIAAGAVVATSLTVPVAADAATAAPGAPMRVHATEPSIEDLPIELDSGMCSQGPVGTVTQADGTQSQVMLTAAHCTTALDETWIPTESVFVPRPEGDELIGHRGPHELENGETGNFGVDMVNLVTGPDWSVVNLLDGVSTTRMADSVTHAGTPTGAPVELTGIRDYQNVPRGQVSVDNFGQPICKDGNNSGRSCGYQVFRTQHAVFSYGLDYANGDSGGINYDPNNGEAIGVTSQGWGPIGRAQTADAALQDAYGIPDGQVNEHFQLSESVEPHDTNFRTLNDDDAAAADWINQNYPAPDFRGEFDAEVANAQADAAKFGAELQAGVANGDFAAVESTASEAAATAEQYSHTLPELGINAALEEALSY